MIESELMGIEKYISKKTSGIKRRTVRQIKVFAKVLLGNPKSTPSLSSGFTSTDYTSYGENKVINHPKLSKSKIIFEGRNNILYCEEGLTLVKSEVCFKGDNGILYLSKTKGNKYHGTFFISHNSAIFIGANTRFNMGKYVDIHASDHKHIIIGEDCLFSWNPWIFTSDEHPIYDTVTKRRLNPGRSVLIGDHVWVGQGVSILKGTIIGSGAIIGSNSVLSGKTYSSNSSNVGIPAREIRKNVFFTKQSINHTDTKKLSHTAEYSSDEFIYSYNPEEQLTLEEIDRQLSSANTAREKLEYIRKNLANNRARNRFYINNEGV